MGDVQHARRTGSWERQGTVRKGMDCWRYGAWWEKKWIAGDIGHDGEKNDLWEIWDMAAEGMDCGKGD